MGKKKKPSAKKKAPEPTKKPEKVQNIYANLGEASLPAWAKAALAVLAFYLFAMLIFPRIIFDHYNFVFGGDNLAAAPIARMGEEFQKEGNIPHWCPYIFGGMPLVGSLLYANHFYWAFNPTIKAILSFLFFSSDFGWLFFHYLLAGLGIFLLLRDFRVHWIIALLCGILFAYNLSMVVFADVGHGSKVMTIAYLPWILYFTRRLFDRPGPGWAAALALLFGLQLLALHMQIAYYGAMLMGLFALYSFISGGQVELKKNIRAALWLVAAGAVAFALSAPLYLQILEYSAYSIRGGPGGGATWDYATAWSFHPLESLTYIFPSFFGFGGETYWGFMPFTDMPLYWGGLILLFAPWAIVLKRDRMTIFLIILAGLAWIVSFGKFLPVLYWPLYEFLPYFNKFRVPSLIQVLVLLPMVVLAGRGLQAIWETGNCRTTSGDEARELGKKLLFVGLITAGLCLLLLIFQSALRQPFLGWITSARPQMQIHDAQAAYSLFAGDLGRLILLICALYGVSTLVLRRQLPSWTLLAAITVVVILELNHFDKKLIHPTPPQYMENYLQADDVVNFLRQEDEPFRIFPLSAGRNQDWYMPHHIESFLGYSAAKLRIYQDAIDSLTHNNQSLWKLMNLRYFISDRPIVHDDFEEVFVGAKERVYRYKRAFPRAFLVNRAVRVASASEVFELYRTAEFDFSRVAALEFPPGQDGTLSARLDEGATGSVSWVERTPDHLTLGVESSGRQLLVLSEIYYPSGWRATIDGREIPILKCNYLFRGLEIPAGVHRVEMSFKPKSAGRGNALKWTAIAIIIIGFAAALLRRPALAGSRAQENAGPEGRAYASGI